MRKQWLWLIIGILAWGSSLGAVKSVWAATPEGTLVIAFPDLGNMVATPSQEFAFGKSYMRLIHTAVVGITEDGKLSPDTGAATKWERSADGMTWTFWLRDTIKFHNGDPLTAEDVKFSLEKMIDAKAVASYAGGLRNQIASIEVIEPYKLVIKTKQPSAFLPWDISDVQGTEGMIQPKKYTESVGDDGYNKQPVGSGPYRVVALKHGDTLTLEALDNHWLIGKPKYKTLIFKKVPEESTRIAMLKTGEADIISVSRERSAEFRSTPGFHLYTQPRQVILGFYFHEQWRPEVPISKLQVRQALNLAINRKELVEFVFAGLASPGAVYPIPALAPGADAKLEAYPYDPDKARQLLKDAGYPNGFSITVYSYPRADVPELPRLIEAIEGYFAEIGVKANIVPTEYASYRQKRLGKTLPGEMGALAAPNRPLAGFVTLARSLYHSAGGFTSMMDATMDKLVEKLETTLDEAEAERLHTEVYRHLYHHYNHLSVADLDIPYAASAKVVQWNIGGVPWDQNFLSLVRQ